MVDGKAILKSVMTRKNVKTGTVADAVGYKDRRQAFANWLQYNKMTLEKFAEVADFLGCDVVLLDRESGELYK